MRGGILDCRCARRSARRQVGTKGWSYSDRTKGWALELNSTALATMPNLLNLTHTTDLPTKATPFRIILWRYWEQSEHGIARFNPAVRNGKNRPTVPANWRHDQHSANSSLRQTATTSFESSLFCRPAR